MADWMEWVQWPAMAATLAASWLVSSSLPGRRNTGFWVFMLSNVLWVAWGLYSHAPALVALQFCLAALNIRGAFKTGKQEEAEDSPNGAAAANRSTR